MAEFENQIGLIGLCQLDILGSTGVCTNCQFNLLGLGMAFVNVFDLAGDQQDELTSIVCFACRNRNLKIFSVKTNEARWLA